MGCSPGGGAPPPLQIFATDLHEPSLERARHGYFPADIEADVSTERLERFFQRENEGYRVRKQLRDLVVFVPHDLLSDPPFSRIDMILCRNLLIYLQREVQQEVAEPFHYALRPDGVPALGAAERMELGDLFRPEDRKQGIYRRRRAPPHELRLPVFPMIPPRPAVRPAREAEGSAYGTLHTEMAERYALPSLLVSPDDNVVFLSAAATRYVDVRGGALSQSVHRLVREELQVDLRQAIHHARRRGESERCSPVLIRREGVAERVTMTVTPSDYADEDGFLFVTFDACPSALPSVQASPGARRGSRTSWHSRSRT